MEMDIITNNNWIEEEGAYPEALGLSDADRDPELLPRIGDNFQVEIPLLLSKLAYLERRNNPCHSHEYSVGLPISLMWIKDKVENVKHESQDVLSRLNCSSNTAESTKNDSTNGAQVKAESLDVKPHNGIDLLEEFKDQLHRLVPGSVEGIWSDIEEASFLLGLYIFGKNFVQVVKFVETKDMGEILSFYYGSFYRSEKYKRWSGCRNMRNRRCIYGQRIFSGSTLQELLSRLFLHVTEDCKKTLTEVTKAYGEGKLSLEEYVFTLKAIVGLNALIEAVGIGKRKQDLTGMTMEHPKTNSSTLTRPEIPVGKACSSLSPLEITNFLNGGYRLSKARSNDLFWEAVWPRLLARGWHSEQPRDHGLAGGSRCSLVFLVPGVKKFSRRKLVKGNHYFDSVADVLNKVGSDPALLELDNGCENGWTGEKESGQVDLKDHQRHCYLKPRTPSRSAETLKFTVVDTSLPNGEESKVRELRSLPVEIMNTSSFRIGSEESDGDSSSSTSTEYDSLDDKTDISKSTKISIGNKDSYDKNGGNNNALKQKSTVIVLGVKVPRDLRKDPKIGVCDEMKPEKPVKARLTNKTRTRDRKPAAPVAKRRRMVTAFDRAAAGCNTDERLQRDEAVGMNLVSDRTCCSSTNECTSSCNEHRIEKPQPRALIDLNIPAPQDTENESFTTDMFGNGQMYDDGNGSVESDVQKASSEEPEGMNSRRQSRRNRPLTTKALEALACGFLNIGQKKHSRDGFGMEDLVSRPSRRARSRVRIAEDLNSEPVGVMDFEGGERMSTECESNADMISELKV